MPLYKRIILKFSGEILREEQSIFSTNLDYVISHLKDAHSLGVEVAVVIGAGNIVRGANASQMGVGRFSLDYMGMLGTVMNGLFLKDYFEKRGLTSVLQSALPVEGVVDTFSKQKAGEVLEKKQVLLLSGGTGHPYFTTDTAAALRGIELNCDAFIKATKVDGVYDADPFKNPGAKKFDQLTYLEAIERKLKVMDITSLSLCRENKLPIVVFNMKEEGHLKKILLGEKVGTLIT